MFYQELNLVLDCLPSEKVKASNLKQGDVAKIYPKSWSLIVSDFNTANSVELYSEAGSDHHYFKPNDMVTIVLRSALDQKIMKKVITKSLKEKEKRRIRDEKEFQKEIKREKAELKKRLKELG